MERKISIAILRPSCIYGENEGFDLDKCHMLPAMVRRIVEGTDFIEVWGDGTQKRDFIHVDDAASACLVALKKVDDFDIFNIGNGMSYSTNDIIDIICRSAGVPIPRIEYLDVSYKIEKEREMAFDKMKSVLKFIPSIDFKNGVNRLIKESRKDYG